MNKAIIFPGQGSQFVGMGKEFFDNFSVAKEVFEEVDEVLETKLSKIIFEGPSNELTLTKNTQPALMATSIAIMRVIESETGKSIEEYSRFTAGHSLGEFTALCASKAISLSNTAELLKIRGSSMQEAVPTGKGAMAAILGMDYETLNSICISASQGGICQIANDNCPGQIVISGDKEQVLNAIELVKAEGKKAILLDVSAPFHSDLMKPVTQIMKNALSLVQISTPVIPVIANVTAQEVINSDEIRQNLALQVTGMVRWTESMNYMINKNIDTFIEIGSGKVLTGIAKRINKDVNSFSVGTVEDLKLLFEKIA